MLTFLDTEKGNSRAVTLFQRHSTNSHRLTHGAHWKWGRAVPHRAAESRDGRGGGGRRGPLHGRPVNRLLGCRETRRHGRHVRCRSVEHRGRNGRHVHGRSVEDEGRSREHGGRGGRHGCLLLLRHALRRVAVLAI